MRRPLLQPGIAARLSEQITEGFLCKRSPALACDECQITARSCLKRLDKYRQDWQCYFGISLFGFDGTDTIANMLATKPNGIATAKAGVNQDIEPYALSRSLANVFHKPQRHLLTKVQSRRSWDAVDYLRR